MISHGGELFLEVILERLKLKASTKVSRELLESMSMQVYQDRLIDALVFELSAYVFAEKVPSPASVTEQHTFRQEVPASPWQQYKRDHADTWWLRWLVERRPPVLREHTYTGRITVDIARYWAYPEARLTAELGRAVRVALPRTDAKWWED